MSQKKKSPAAGWLGMAVLASGLAGVPIASGAAWISSYGTTETEVGASLFDTDQGDYVLLGQESTTGNALVARLDRDGGITWNRKLTAGWTPFAGAPADPEAIGFFNASVPNGKSLQWTRLRFDPATGSFTAEFSKNLPGSLSGSFAIGAAKTVSPGATEAFVLGTRDATANTAADIFVAKLAADGSFTWSRILNFPASDRNFPVFTNPPRVLKLSDGYLVSWAVTVHNLLCGQNACAGLNGIVLVKLDASGNRVPGASRFFANNYVDRTVQNVNLSDWVALTTGDIVVGAQKPQAPGQFFLAKLNSALQVQWQADYSDPQAALRLGEIREVSNEALEIRGTRSASESHPVRLSVNASTGAITAQSEIQVRQLDSLSLSGNGGREVLLSGASKSLSTDPGDGVFARLDSNLQPTWARSLSGVPGGTFSSIKANAQASGYLLSGQANSSGVGQGDLLAGVLDANGDSKGCTAIRDESGALQVIASSITGTILLPEADAATFATVTDKGSAGQPVNVSANIATVDAGLIRTPFCEPNAAVNGISANPAVFGAATQVRLSGSGFGTRKGKVFLGRNKAKIIAWSDNQIVILPPRKAKAGSLSLTVVPKGKAALTGPNVLLVAPVVGRLSNASGAKGATVTVRGNYFGGRKPSIRFVLGSKGKAGRVRTFTEKALQVTVPKLKAGTYQIQVKTTAGTGSNPAVTFTVQ